MKNNRTRGFTLIELIISIGLFALVMTLAAGAYLVVIGVSRQSQGITSGIDNLSFALETMTRTIRTGTTYNCGGAGDCPGLGGNSFSVKNSSVDPVNPVNYTLVGGVIMQTIGGNTAPLTDSSVTVTSLKFYATGTATNDTKQARVTIVVSGTVLGQSKTVPVPFTIETSATMRGSDI